MSSSSAEPFIPNGVWIPKAIIAIVSRFAVPLYLELRRHCYDRPECFPGHRRLARAIGCAIGTVNALTDQFDALGIIKKLHRGRHCLYRFGAGYWRRRQPRHARQKPRKSADCSPKRTEDENNKIVPVERASKPKKPKISQRSALSCRAQQRAERCEKRRNLIKTLRRWTEASLHSAEDQQRYRLAMLDRAEERLDDWRGRSPEDQRCFEWLVDQARAKPLDAAIVRSLGQRPRPPDANSLGALLVRQGWTGHASERRPRL